MKKLQKKLRLLSLLLVAGLLFSGLTIPAKAFIQKQGTVNEAVTLRQNADSSSDQVMELANGQAVTVNNELTGADGAKWYQLFVNGTTLGYVPVSTVTISGNASGSTIPTIEGEGQQTNTVTVTERVGTVTANSAVRVRAQATTSSEQVASMEPNDTFLVLNDVSAADGYVWHEIEFDDNGKEVHGYVRSDLVSVKEVTREEEAPSTGIPPITAPSDDTAADAPYSVISKENAEGTATWYLRDAATGTEKEIASLLVPQKEKGGNGGLIAAIVVLAILVIAAAGAATFFYMRWQDAEDFINDLRDKQVRARKQPMQNNRTAPTKQSAPKQAPIGKSQPAQKPMSELKPKMTAPKAAQPQPTAKPISQPVSQPAAKPVSKPAPQPVSQPAAQPVSKPAPQPVSQPIVQPTAKQAVQDELPKTKDIVNTTKKELQNKQSAPAANAQPTKAWKSKNFLTDDDDLEFDFLDMEDK